MNKQIIKKIIFFLLIIILITVSINIKFGQVRTRTKAVGQNSTGTNQMDDFAIPERNLQWLQNLGKGEKGILIRTNITTVVKGKVIQIAEVPGQVDDDYGYYFLKSMLIQAENGNQNIVYFSPWRVEVMQIFNKFGKTINFADINKGDIVEIEESLDLLRPNLNDENVLYLIIRVNQS